MIQVRAKDVMPRTLGNLLVKVIHQHKSTLEIGVLLTVTEGRVRLRTLPLNLMFISFTFCCVRHV